MRLTANKLGALIDGIGDALADTLSDSGTTGAALLTLYHWGPISTTELSKIIGLSQSATTRLISRLTDRGYIAFFAQGGRERPLKLTQEGLEHAHYLQGQRNAVLEHVLSPLNEEDQEILDGILSKILGGVVEGKKHARRICRNCDHQKCVGELCPVGEAARSIEWNGQKDDPHT